MRKFLGVLCVLLLTFPLLAQQRTGNIVGKVVDEDTNALPGVTVTLTGSLTAPMVRITSAEGFFRFPSLSPSDDYKIKCELEGFKTKTETNGSLYFQLAGIYPISRKGVNDLEPVVNRDILIFHTLKEKRGGWI